MGRKAVPSQCDRLLAHLRAYGTVNPWEAWTRLGIARLAARIHDLRERGFNIHTIKTEDTNRWGERVTYATYRLRERKQAASGEEKDERGVCPGWVRGCRGAAGGQGLSEHEPGGIAD